MKAFILLISLFISGLLSAQNHVVPYSSDYEFKEGIYLTVQQFFGNNPLSREKINTSGPKGQLDFFSQLVEEKYILTKDSSGTEQKITTASIWGYCQNNGIYINFNHAFNRISVIGSICHFTANVTVSTGYHDPMDYTYAMRNTYEELHQFIFIPEMNKVMDFNVKNMESVLKNDDELYTAFMKLKKRAKAGAIFIYLRKYNEKHPLYLSAK